MYITKTVAEQRFGYNVTAAANAWRTSRYSCCPCCVKGEQIINSSQE
jgi:hypothetical protein